MWAQHIRQTYLLAFALNDVRSVHVSCSGHVLFLRAGSSGHNGPNLFRCTCSPIDSPHSTSSRTKNDWRERKQFRSWYSGIASTKESVRNQLSHRCQIQLVSTSVNVRNESYVAGSGNYGNLGGLQGGLRAPGLQGLPSQWSGLPVCLFTIPIESMERLRQTNMLAVSFGWTAVP